MNCPHCETPIEEHKAERCLDAWVAEYVMGLCSHFLEFEWTDEKGDRYCECKKCGETIKHPELKIYSTDISAAWRVIEAMNNEQIQGHVGPTRLHRLKQCSGTSWGVIWCSDFGYTEEVFASTASLAICRAAIKAK